LGDEKKQDAIKLLQDAKKGYEGVSELASDLGKLDQALKGLQQKPK
jgi:hypothetical protein